MSALINVASNLYMPSSDTFGLYNKEIVHKLLVNVQYDFSISLQKAVDMSIMYMIDYRPGNPQCCKIPNGYLIFLSSKEDEWWRWVYQFSHEYCHSLINGASSDDISGLIWFEETMCDLSSIYQLRNLIVLCDKSANPLLRAHKIVANQCLAANFGKPQYNCQEYLLSVADRLAESEFHREIYSNLSATMFPLFVENPHLWKIILHFGDMRQWNCLKDLFIHLHQTADDSYSDSLKQLENLLFS